jgi:hypothetical protein
LGGVYFSTADCQGAASQWAAQRALEQQGSDFDAAAAAAAGRPVLLTGEMIFPWCVPRKEVC